MLPTHSRAILGHEYETTVLPAKPGRTVFLRLVKVLAAGATGAGGKVSAGTWAAGVAGIAGAVERLSEEDLEFFTVAFWNASTVQLEGGARVPVSSVYELHFAGHMRAMLEWLLFCFEVNFADFFGEARSQLGELWDLVMTNVSASSSRTTSIGGSGDLSPTTESDSL